MLYWFDPSSRALDPLQAADAAGLGVKEGHIEKALAGRPECLFRSSVVGPPVLIIRKSQPGVRMADIIGLDAFGRLVLIECKRGWADRDTLSQLLDYAADYHRAPFERLCQDWAAGEGKGGVPLLDAYRAFAEDPTVEAGDVGNQQVLVVVAAGADAGFGRIADYLRDRGVVVHVVQVGLFRRSGGGDLFLEVEPIDIDPPGYVPEPAPAGDSAWMINTDETHSSGAHERMVDKGVAGIWGYPEGPAPLDQGARVGDHIYAYRNGVGIVAAGVVVDPEVRRATPESSVFPQCKDTNEWQIRVDWKKLVKPVTNAAVRHATGSSLPVRNSFCRLWKPKVRDFLAEQSG